MGSKGSRKNARRAQRERRAANRPVDPEDLPRPLRLILEGQERLVDYARSTADPAGAIALAEERLDEALARLVEVLGRHYPLDIAELIHLRNLTGDPETYRETDHDGNLSIVEIATLVAAAMPAPAAALEEMRLVPPAVALEAEAAAFEALEAASMRVLFTAAEDAADPLSPIGFGSVLREMSLRNTEYPHMLRDTLVGLFGEPSIEAALAAATGLTIAEILAFIDAADQLRQQRWNDRLAVLGPISPLVDAAPQDPEEAARTREAIAKVQAMALSSPADRGAVSVADLATESGLSESKSKSFLDLFSLDCSALDPAEAARDLLSGASPLRLRPIVVDATGRASVCHSPLMLAAVRPRLEDVLFDAGMEAAYTKHRGDYTEREAVRLIASVLPSPTVHRGFEYFVPDPKAGTPQDGPGSTPAQYTSRVEGDGLIIVDDIAIIVESKAVDVSDGTRQGFLGGIRRNLRSLITKTVEQAHRMRSRIEKDGGLRLRDDNWLDLSGVREIHSIAVTLEDLSGIATVTSQLVDANLVDPDALPWIVSLHDLRIITELVDRPADLLFFLRRRTNPNVTRRFWAMDELDFYMHFLATGLFVERDPDEVAAEMPHLPPPTNADRRRFREQGHQFLTSRTGPLDDWYFYKLGIRTTAADKPTAVGSDELWRLVDGVTASGKPGWPVAALALTEGSYEARRRILDGAARAVAQTRTDGRRHTFTALWADSKETSTVLILASVPTPVNESDIGFLTDYMAAKKHQAQAALATTILLDASGEVVDLLYNSAPAGPDPDLDALGARLGLHALERTPVLPPKAREKQKKRLAEQAKIAREKRAREESRRLR